MKRVVKTLIVGGGIGGLTAAIALKRRNIEADIVEINPAWSVYGVGIIQPSNQLRALRELGLGDACLAAGYGFPGYQLCDFRGARLAEASSLNVAGPGYPAVNGITRSALHKILQEAIRSQGTTVRLGVSVEDWEERADDVLVRFTDGSTGCYDLVICADGAYSKMRAKLFGAAVKPWYAGQGAWRYNFRRPADLDWGQIWFGPRSKAGLIPLSEDLMYMFLLTPEPGNPHMPPDQLHHLMRERLAGFGGLFGELRDQIVDPARVVYRPMDVLKVDRPWHRGRIILIGDAAHAGTPHLASGASMAIEDALVLAEMLAEASPVRGELDATLDEFEARRAPRVELVFNTGLKLVEWELDGWAGRPVSEEEHGKLMDDTWATLLAPI